MLLYQKVHQPTWHFEWVSLSSLDRKWQFKQEVSHHTIIEQLDKHQCNMIRHYVSNLKLVFMHMQMCLHALQFKQMANPSKDAEGPEF